MNRLVAHLAASAVLFGSLAQSAELSVNITDIRAMRGTLKIAVVDSAAGWDNQAKPVAARALVPTTDSVNLTFPDLKPGTYAVQVMHDENDNGKLDSNLIGMPIEGYGFSNNPQVMRKPNFDESKFELTQPVQTVVVQLR